MMNKLDSLYPVSEAENGHGMREKISSKVEKVLDFVDQQDKEGARVDERLFSYLGFLQGYDMPHYEEDGYLFTTTDLDREWQLLAPIDTLAGIAIEMSEGIGDF